MANAPASNPQLQNFFNLQTFIDLKLYYDQQLLQQQNIIQQQQNQLQHQQSQLQEQDRTIALKDLQVLQLQNQAQEQQNIVGLREHQLREQQTTINSQQTQLRNKDINIQRLVAQNNRNVEAYKNLLSANDKLKENNSHKESLIQELRLRRSEQDNQLRTLREKNNRLNDLLIQKNSNTQADQLPLQNPHPVIPQANNISVANNPHSIFNLNNNLSIFPAYSVSNIVPSMTAPECPEGIPSAKTVVDIIRCLPPTALPPYLYFTDAEQQQTPAVTTVPNAIIPVPLAQNVATNSLF